MSVSIINVEGGGGSEMDQRSQMLQSQYVESNINALKYANDKGKLTAWQSFISIVKGYCAIVILILPKNYQNGGYGVSTLTLMLSAILTTYCAIKLIQTAQKTGVVNYSKIGKLAFGN